MIGIGIAILVVLVLLFLFEFWAAVVLHNMIQGLYKDD